MKCAPGMEGPFETTGTTNSEFMRKFIDLAEPEHKMYVLTADIVYKYKTR
jgi:predicted small metal-binding protein